MLLVFFSDPYRAKSGLNDIHPSINKPVNDDEIEEFFGSDTMDNGNETSIVRPLGVGDRNSVETVASDDSVVNDDYGAVDPVLAGRHLAEQHEAIAKAVASLSNGDLIGGNLAQFPALAAAIKSIWKSK